MWNILLLNPESHFEDCSKTPAVILTAELALISGLFILVLTRNCIAYMDQYWCVLNCIILIGWI